MAATKAGSEREGFFVEMSCSQLSERGQMVSGDIYIQRRLGNRSLLVLSDGAGSGVKANIKAGVISSMALNYALADKSATHAARAIIRTFAGSGEERPATFTMMDIHRGGEVRVVEYDNPPYVLLRGGRVVGPERETVEMDEGRRIVRSRFMAEIEDRLVLFSDGVAASGIAEWGHEGVAEFCRERVGDDPGVSAFALARAVMARAEQNDQFAPKNDMTCVTVYFRRPRRILVCTGPPYREENDAALADMVARYDGTVMICGGTTAQIVSRELGREVKVQLRRDPAGLPPTSTMEGVAMVTEGVLTLSKVKSLLENMAGSEIDRQGTDAAVARLLLGHDIIEFRVGTRINPIHQDPDLPLELELRRNLVKGLGAVLETKFMKEITINHI